MTSHSRNFVEYQRKCLVDERLSKPSWKIYKNIFFFSNKSNKCLFLGHIVKDRLDWICKTRTGFVKHGFVKRGFVKGGLSLFVKMIVLFDCLFVYFCLSLFNLNSFTLYYFHFMLPLHIQIISLKDCLILSNISIWKFLRIIEKYEKHSLTASKYSRHFRHSLVFKNKIPRTYI